MLFIVLTFSFTLAILLAAGLAAFIMLQPKVFKWYVKQTVKLMDGFEVIFNETKDGSK